MSVVEQVLNIYLGSVWKEGERFAKIKVLAISLQIIGGLRRMALTLFFSFIGCMLFTASVFSLVVYNTNAPILRWDLFNISMAVISAAFLALFYWNFREKTWINAFGIPHLLMRLEREPEEPIIDDDLERKLDALIDKRLTKKLGSFEDLQHKNV